MGNARNTGNDKLAVVRAYDRALIGEVETQDGAALEAALDAADRAFRDRDAWLQPFERIAILGRLADLMEGKRAHFAAQIAAEGGKPLTDAIVEVTRAIDGVRCAADELRTFAGREIPMGLTAASVNRWAFTTREPIGLVVAISAFNHPLNLIVHQVVPAIATGCPIIVKPASATPLCCRDFVSLVHEAGLREDWCQMFLPRDHALAERLATDRRVAFLSFIGSGEVGWRLRAKLSPGTRVALEHGGAAPAIVDRTADLARTIELVAKGGFYHAGQVCVSTQRLFVHEDVVADFTDALVDRVKRLRVGDPDDADTEIGPLILPGEADRVVRWTDEAVADGARPVLRGGRLSQTTLAPTILVDPPADAKVSRQEVFGPVVAIYPYARLDDAIARANDLPGAFQASIFAQDIAAATRAASRLDASAVMVNEATTFRTDWMPFAGRRESGYGVGGIPATMHDMTQEKMVVVA